MPTPPQIGTLDWRPAADHPELLAAPVAASLSSLGIDAYVAPIDPDLADTAAFCAAYAVPLDVSANCVVVAGRRAENSIMAGCLVLATDRADVNKTIRKHLDVRKISFADMADAVAAPAWSTAASPRWACPPAGRSWSTRPSPRWTGS